MANIVTISTTTTNPTSGMTVSNNVDRYALFGNFTYYFIGNVLYITGSTSVLKFDLTTDTATVNGVGSLSAAAAVNALNTAFIK